MSIEPSVSDAETLSGDFMSLAAHLAKINSGRPVIEGGDGTYVHRDVCIEAIQALLAAETEAAVAWRWKTIGSDLWNYGQNEADAHWCSGPRKMVQPLYTHPVLPDREGDAETRLSVIRKSLLMALYGSIAPRPEPTIELVKALVAVADTAQEATTNARIALMSRTTREAFERELHEGIVNRLGILTVGTCSCDTKTPELKYHSEACRYRIASEALELARPLYAASPATGEREPSRATDTAGENDGWKHDRPFITTSSGPDGKKFVSVLVRTMDALHDAHDLVINAFKAAGAK